MTMKAFIIVFITVAGLVAGAVCLHHWSGSGDGTRSFSLHGGLGR